MDVMFIQIVNRKIEIHTNSDVINGAVMDQLERVLSDYGYVKVEQSVLANIESINNCDWSRGIITFKNGETCLLSRRNEKKVRQLFDKK